VTALAQQMGEALADYPIAKQKRRLARRQKRWDALDALHEHRAQDADLVKAGGAGAGVLAPQAKGPPQVDAAALREQRHLERETAEELGQREVAPAVAVQVNNVWLRPRAELLALSPEEQLRLLTEPDYRPAGL
jgi:hypothetical protein